VTAVTPSRESLEAALGEAWLSGAPFKPGGTVDLGSFADALIASGAVVPLDTLADDEAVMAAVSRGVHAVTCSSDQCPGPVFLERRSAEAALRALAAALSERGDR
jgi:hypothetical protein